MADIGSSTPGTGTPIDPWGADCVNNPEICCKLYGSPGGIGQGNPLECVGDPCDGGGCGGGFGGGWPPVIPPAKCPIDSEPSDCICFPGLHYDLIVHTRLDLLPRKGWVYEGSAAIFPGTTFYRKIDHYPRHSFIPGTLTPFCSKECFNQTDCVKFFPRCASVCDMVCPAEDTTSIFRHPYSGVTGTTFIINSTATNNQVKNTVLQTLGGNTMEFSSMGSSPVRTLSVNKFGSLYVLNHWAWGYPGSTSAFLGISGNAIPNHIKSLKIPLPPPAQTNNIKTITCNIAYHLPQIYNRSANFGGDSVYGEEGFLSGFPEPNNPCCDDYWNHTQVNSSSTVAYAIGIDNEGQIACIPTEEIKNQSIDYENALSSPNGDPKLLHYPMSCWGASPGVTLNEDASRIAAGGFHTLVVKTNGKVIGWGNNFSRQLNVPSSLTGVKTIVTGGAANGRWADYWYSGVTHFRYHTYGLTGHSHTVALKTDGGITAWGSNKWGQCTIPSDLSTVTEIAAGYGYTVALQSGGGVTAWGRNDFGQRDIPTADLSGITHIAAGAFTTLLLKNNRTTIIQHGLTFQAVPNTPQGTTVKQLSSGYGHNLVLYTDGTVDGWGLNGFGQISNLEQLSDVHSVAAGWHHSVFLLNDGTVQCRGLNTSGQCTVPDGLSGVTGIAAGYGHTVARKSDGTVVVWGDNRYNQTEVPTNELKRFKKILVQNNGHIQWAPWLHTETAIGLYEDGTVRAWGESRLDEEMYKRHEASCPNQFAAPGCVTWTLEKHYPTGITLSLNSLRNLPHLTGVTEIHIAHQTGLAFGKDGTWQVWGEPITTNDGIPVTVDDIKLTTRIKPRTDGSSNPGPGYWIGLHAITGGTRFVDGIEELPAPDYIVNNNNGWDLIAGSGFHRRRSQPTNQYLGHGLVFAGVKQSQLYTGGMVSCYKGPGDSQCEPMSLGAVPWRMADPDPQATVVEDGWWTNKGITGIRKISTSLWPTGSIAGLALPNMLEDQLDIVREDGTIRCIRHYPKYGYPLFSPYATVLSVWNGDGITGVQELFTQNNITTAIKKDCFVSWLTVIPRKDQGTMGPDYHGDPVRYRLSWSTCQDGNWYTDTLENLQQVAHGETYAALGIFRGVLPFLKKSEQTDPNGTGKIAAVAGVSNKVYNELIERGAIATDPHRYSTPIYLSGNKSQAGIASNMGTTQEGDVFAVAWTNTANTPYRSFGMDYYRVQETSEGTTWQSNYSDVSKGVFGVRPDLLIWRAVNQLLLTNQWLMRGATSCAGLSGNICAPMEMYTGEEQFWECNEDALTPSTVYYKQVSLGNQHGLLTVGGFPFDRSRHQVNDPTNPTDWFSARRKLNADRAEENSLLFTFSGSTVSAIPPGITTWSSSGITTSQLLFTFNLNVLNGPSSLSNTTVSNRLDYKKDRIMQIEFTDGTTLVDEYNDVCARNLIENRDDGGRAPATINRTVCGYEGFSGCKETQIDYGHASHPVWNRGTSDMPSVNIMAAAQIARRVWNIGSGQLPNHILSWDWISAGSSGNSCAVISASPRETDTETSINDTKFICWGPNYDKPVIDLKHWPQGTGITTDSHIEIRDAGCGATLEIHWKPCQVDLSMESPIFYFKASPFAAGHISPIDWQFGIAEYNYRSTYNTISKVLVFGGNGWTFHENATIGDPIPAITRYRNQENNQDSFDTPLWTELNKTVYWPNGRNQFQHDTKIMGTYKTQNNDDVMLPTRIHETPNTLIDNEIIRFVPWRYIFDNLDGLYENPEEVLHNYPFGQLPFWRRNSEFPSWTPEYPVVSGDSWLQNIYTPSSCASGHLRCLGPTGCCKNSDECTPNTYEEECDGTWTEGPCSTQCGCIRFDETPIQVNFTNLAGSQGVSLSNESSICSWSMEGDLPLWITSVNPSSGNGNTITITVQQNGTSNTRTHTITLRSGTVTKQIRVIQAAASGGGGGGGDGGGGGGGGGGSGVNCCDYFVGPCCKTTGCEENQTPQQCHNLGGLFLGFNRTCADCPS